LGRPRGNNNPAKVGYLHHPFDYNNRSSSFSSGSLLLFFIKESLEKFSRKIPNILLLLIGLGLITLLAFVNKSIIILGTNYGWTAYPPLSMIPESGPEDAALNPFVASLVNALTVLQILVTVALLYVVFHWGRNTKQND
jgi:heme/copper-type cytochrome/quinol oxidase subunit 1